MRGVLPTQHGRTRRGTARHGTVAQQPQPGSLLGWLGLPTAPAEVEAKGCKSTRVEEAGDPLVRFLLFRLKPPVCFSYLSV